MPTCHQFHCDWLTIIRIHLDVCILHHCPATGRQVRIQPHRGGKPTTLCNSVTRDIHSRHIYSVHVRSYHPTRSQHYREVRVRCSRSPSRVVFNIVFLAATGEMDATTQLALAMQAVRASRLTQYLGAMGMVLVLYDGLLTIKDEVSLILMRLGSVSF